jgi:hypothetical protein
MSALYHPVITCIKGDEKGINGGLRGVPTPLTSLSGNWDFDFAVRHVIQESPRGYAGFPFCRFLLDTVGDFVFFPITVMKELQNRGVG